MILADTSVWISHLRRGEQRLEAELEEAEVWVHPFIIGELACGNLKNRGAVLSLLQALPTAPVLSQEEILYFIEQKSLMGSGLGFVDVHLLASAKLKGIPIWTFDTALERAASKLKISYSQPGRAKSKQARPG